MGRVGHSSSSQFFIVSNKECTKQMIDGLKHSTSWTTKEFLLDPSFDFQEIKFATNSIIFVKEGNLKILLDLVLHLNLLIINVRHEDSKAFMLSRFVQKVFYIPVDAHCFRLNCNTFPLKCLKYLGFIMLYFIFQFYKARRIIENNYTSLSVDILISYICLYF